MYILDDRFVQAVWLLICLLLFTCNYVVSVWRGFLWDGLRYFIVALPEPSI